METITMNYIGVGMHSKTLTSIYWYELPGKKCYIALDVNGKLTDCSDVHPQECRAFYIPVDPSDK